jgi:Integrase core domain
MRAIIGHSATRSLCLSAVGQIRRLLTDNGHCYRSGAFREACFELGLRHHFTRPYTPRTNGKAERFIQTALREWVYACSYQDSEQRNAQMPPWLHHYNWHRPHGSLNHVPPISRSGLEQDNLLRLHTKFRFGLCRSQRRMQDVCVIRMLNKQLAQRSLNEHHHSSRSMQSARKRAATRHFFLLASSWACDVMRGPGSRGCSFR